MPAIASKIAKQSVPPSSSAASPTLRASSDGQCADFVDVPDPDFHDFDSSRTENDIKPGQIWALYDDKDGMPRYYGRINSVSLSPFKVQFCWLVPYRPSEDSRSWSKSTGFCLSGAEFENGKNTAAKIINMFSHKVNINGGSVTRAPKVLKIYPTKGDVWAMYRNWNQVRAKSRTQAPSDVTCSYDMVEIISDYCKVNGVKTVTLAKVQNFRTVFHRRDDRQATRIWYAADLLKFSHCVPAEKMKEDKLIGIPRQAWELDPAATPLDYSDPVDETGDINMGSQPVDGSRDMETRSQHGKKNSKAALPSNSTEGKAGTDVDVSGLAVEQRLKLRGSSSPTTATGATATPRSSAQSEVPTNVQTVPDSDFHDFNSLRTKADIEAGQIWAIYDPVDRMPRFYVRVTRVLESPFKVDIWRLTPHPSCDALKAWMDHTDVTMSCGEFKNDKRDVLGHQQFSHVVLNRANESVKIYPRKGEVWAMYRDWDRDQDDQRTEGGRKHHTNSYDLVEILEDFVEEKGLKMLKLAKVMGFRSLFQREGKPLITGVARPEILLQFSHSIPARRMYKDESLRIPFGTLELDPACIPLQMIVTQSYQSRKRRLSQI